MTRFEPLSTAYQEGASTCMATSDSYFIIGNLQQKINRNSISNEAWTVINK